MAQSSTAIIPVAQRAQMSTLYAGFTQTLRQRNVISQRDPDPHAWGIPYPDRALFVLDARSFSGHVEKVTTSAFRSSLQQNLDGRRVLVTSSPYGTILQVSWEPAPVFLLPDRVDLRLRDRQPGLHIPMGLTRRGPVWIPIQSLGATMVGGNRQHGKSNLLHSWILSLLDRDPARIQMVLHDGKDKAKFGIYEGLPTVMAVTGTGVELARVLATLASKIELRSALMREYGAQHIRNLPEEVRPPTILMILDEYAMAIRTESVADAVTDLVTRGGDFGILPVIVVHDPKGVVTSLLKTNLGSRICFYVPDGTTSQNLLGEWGAEKLDPGQPGRFMVKLGGKAVEIQGYYVPDRLITDEVGRLRGEHQVEPVNVATPPLSLDREEVAMVREAVRQDYAFSPARIAEATGISRYRAEKRLKAWTAAGLVEPPHNGPNGKVSARITEQLIRMAGIEEPS